MNRFDDFRLWARQLATMPRKQAFSYVDRNQKFLDYTQVFLKAIKSGRSLDAEQQLFIAMLDEENLLIKQLHSIRRYILVRALFLWVLFLIIDSAMLFLDRLIQLELLAYSLIAVSYLWIAFFVAWLWLKIPQGLLWSGVGLSHLASEWLRWLYLGENIGFKEWNPSHNLSEHGLPQRSRRLQFCKAVMMEKYVMLRYQIDRYFDFAPALELLVGLLALSLHLAPCFAAELRSLLGLGIF